MFFVILYLTCETRSPWVCTVWHLSVLDRLYTIRIIGRHYVKLSITNVICQLSLSALVLALSSVEWASVEHENTNTLYEDPHMHAYMHVRAYLCFMHAHAYASIKCTHTHRTLSQIPSGYQHTHKHSCTIFATFLYNKNRIKLPQNLMTGV